MLLKRLYIQGFKSFARPTTFVFEAGIGAILGPNGSGKTNVVDAIRWVLGDQRSTLLRAPRAEEVLFTGTERHGPVGMAEATVVFEEGGGASLESPAEVAVTRRLFRSGESEYELNHRRIRLRDLWAFLRKHGVGPTTYAIIGQGMIDALLRLRPQERRPLLEEAADITHYLVQVDEAEAKIAATIQNMLRLTDLLGELTPRLESLKNQRERLRRREQIAQALQRLLDRWYAQQWSQLQRELAQREESQQNIRSELQKTQAQERSSRETIAGLQRRSGELEAERTQWQREVMRLSGERDDLERRRRLSAQHLAELKEQRERLQEEVRALELEHLAEETAQKEALRRAEEQRREFRLLEDRAAAVQSALQRHEGLSQGVRRDWLSARVALEEYEAARQQRARRRQRLQQQLTHVEQEYDKLTQRAAALVTEMRGLRSNLKEIERSLADLSEQERRAKAASAAARQALDAALKAFQSAQEAYDRLLERCQETQRELRRLDSQRGDVPGLLREAVGNGGDGVVGVVAQLLEVPPSLEKAIAAALGDTLEGVVVQDWSEVQALLQRLAAVDGSRTSLISLDLIPTNGILPEVHHEAVLGVASELIECHDAYRPLLRALLGTTVVVEDLATARRLVQRHRVSAVTLAGEVLHATGVLRVGGTGSTMGNRLSQRSRRLLAERLAAQEQELLSQGLSLEGIRQHIEALRRDAARQQEEVATTATRLHQSQERLLEQHRALELKERELAWLRSQADGLGRERTQLREEAAAFEREGPVEAPPVEATTLDALHQRLMAAEEEGQRVRRALQEAEAARSIAEGALRAEEKIAEAAAQGLRRLQQMAAARQARLGAIDDEVARLACVLEQQEEEQRQLHASHQKAQQFLAAVEQGIEGPRRQREEAEREVETLQRHILDLERAALQEEVEVRSAAESLERLKRDARAEGIALTTIKTGDDAQDDPSQEGVPSLRAKIDRLRQRLHALGAVSPEVEQEYLETKERHDFLSAQLQDLQATLEKLRHTEAELQHSAQGAFQETLHRVSLAFDRSFQTFFGGGSAQLHLLPGRGDEDGIEILVRLPGKRTLSLSALSGGERALTALAFLFALLSVHPVPFCILDEVDAALDEANAQRFARALREFSTRTQFIVVTHNRTTLQAADRLYGISMGADGVSQVLSLTLPEEPQPATALQVS